MEISAEERKKLKLKGILSCSDGENFAIRVITKNGVMTSKQMTEVARIAEQYACGEVCFTTRLTAEVMYVPYENIEIVQKELQAAGLTTGGTGAKVRPLVSCKGTYCVFGLCDTQEFTAYLHDRFYEGYRDVVLPHKFKIAVGGCPNNCVKPDLNDIGLIGARKPKLDDALCRGCKKCMIEKVCPVGAARVEDGKMKIDDAKCVKCGKCHTKCPFKAMQSAQEGFRIYLGGRWGKANRKGNMLDGIYNREQAADMVEKALLLFKERANAGERFGAMIDRIGVEAVRKAVEGDDLLKRKEEILKKPVGAFEC